MSGIDAFVPEKSKQNPGHFIAEGSRLTNKQKTTVIIERPSYDRITEAHSFDTFATGQSKQNFSKDSVEPKRHIYDYAITNSKIDRHFVRELDASTKVVVCTKPPRCFLIPAPVPAGNHNPD